MEKNKEIAKMKNIKKLITEWEVIRISSETKRELVILKAQSEKFITFDYFIQKLIKIYKKYNE